MVLEISNSEKELLFELIETAHREIIREIDHTDAREYKKLLQDKALQAPPAVITPRNPSSQPAVRPRFSRTMASRR